MSSMVAASRNIVPGMKRAREVMLNLWESDEREEEDA